MGKHIQSSANDTQYVKPVSPVPALQISAGDATVTTPILQIINEISGPTNILQVFPNGVTQAGGALPRLATGVGAGVPTDADGAPDGSLYVCTGTNVLYFKSNGAYHASQ